MRDMPAVEKWKDFLLSDIFEIRKGKRLTKESQIPGDTPFIGATAKNNGITAYIGQESLHEGNAITLSYNGSIGEAFYQADPFWASDDVNALYLKGFPMTEKVALFLCTILRLEKQMWSYARKWSLEKMKDTHIRLPVTSEGQPDYGLMEEYMSGLDSDISHIPDYFLNEGYEKAGWYLDTIDQGRFESEFAGASAENSVSLSGRSWKKFLLREITESIKNGKPYNASSLIPAADGTDYVCYVTRTEKNNGIAMYVQAEEYDGIEKAGAITVGDTTATTFFQNHDFITGPHVIVIRAVWLNTYTASFIITLLDMEKYRYPVFGRAFTKDLIADTELMLPVGSDGLPDYEFMEDYIKSLPFSAKIQ